MKQKKTPLRKCIGCNEMKGKKELIRVVKDADNNYGLDFSGKKPGRGAYICRNQGCLEKAIKEKGLERAFRSAIPKDVYEELGKGLAANE